MNVLETMLRAALREGARELVNGSAAPRCAAEPVAGEVLDDSLALELLPDGSRRICEEKHAGESCRVIARAVVTGNRTGRRHLCAWHAIAAAMGLVVPASRLVRAAIARQVSP
ncbi:MAG: hypothetical protein ACE14L_04895 [Terriglobales bacterium]